MLLVIFHVGLLNLHAYSQNGTYVCSHEMWTSTDGSDKRDYQNKYIVNISINLPLDAYIAMNEPSDNYNLRFDLLSKEGVYVEKDKRRITTTYNGIMNSLNIHVGNDLLIGIVEGMDDNSLKYWIKDKKTGTTNYYLGLEKFKL